MTIYPLQLTSVDWNTYIKVCQEALDISPTRGIDQKGIKTNSPSAFLHTLDLTNQPELAIKRKDLFWHVFFSFIGTSDFEDIAIIAKYLHFTYCFKIGTKADVFIVSATLAEWDHSIITFTNQTYSKPIRQFLNSIKRHLERAGFTDIWGDYEELQHSDETFSLWHK